MLPRGLVLASVSKRVLTRFICSTSDAVSQPLHFANGSRVQPLNSDSKDDIKILDPATGDTLCIMRGSGPDDVNTAVSAAKAAFPAWANTGSTERARILYNAAQIVRDNLETLAWVESKDNGKPLWEARLDMDGCAAAMEWYAGLAPAVAGRHVSMPGHSHGYTRREPLGVVGAIGAFNYPFQMASWKSAPALACGNTLVFKPSPLTPLSAVILGEIYKEAGLPDGCYNVIQGEAKPGELLSSHPDIAKMTFTGSVPTGSKIMAACAKDIKKVTLELGGKSPVLIFPDCDLDNAVKGVLMANFLTQGQVCSNGTRVYVHKSILPQFVKALVAKTTAMRVGDPMDPQTHMGPMISPQQAQKVLNYVQSARDEGAVVECGGERLQLPGPHSGGWYISPCVLTNVLDDMKVAREEVFGPVISVLEFESEEDAVKRANDTIFGLASGLFTKDLQRAHRVAEQLQAGNVYINNYNVYPPQMPFGGHKKSGLGSECGVEGLEYFTQVKTVYVEGGDVWCPYT